MSSGRNLSSPLIIIEKYVAGGGLFGTQQNATSNMGLFGSTTSSAFGQTKPFGFGTQPQTTGLFGQQPQPAQPQQTSLFGQPAAQSTSGLFSTPSGKHSIRPAWKMLLFRKICSSLRRLFSVKRNCCSDLLLDTNCYVPVT